MKISRFAIILLIATPITLQSPANARCNGHKTKWCFDHYWSKRTLETAATISDGLRVFRIDDTSILGKHDPWVPHFHLEEYNAAGKKIANNHIPLQELTK